jgi:hypothetical protein
MDTLVSLDRFYSSICKMLIKINKSITMNKIQLIIFLIINLTFSKEQKKQIYVKYISSEILIDGELDENDWNLAKTASDFYEHFPENGAPSKYKNEIKIMNDDQFLYIGIKVNANTSDL